MRTQKYEVRVHALSPTDRGFHWWWDRYKRLKCHWDEKKKNVQTAALVSLFGPVNKFRSKWPTLSVLEWLSYRRRNLVILTWVRSGHQNMTAVCSHTRSFRSNVVGLSQQTLVLYTVEKTLFLFTQQNKKHWLSMDEFVRTYSAAICNVL